MIESASIIIINVIKKEEDINIAFQSDIITELNNLIKRSPFEHISFEKVFPLNKIWKYGSAKFTH